ncbi:carnitine/acyl carnitine carrier [Cylindrobasidium torrendii FP15055 ss-10]|uniref:Carnitine/acyl carnitine carrier n=1 Tax=Cylindrobasidium torrendii FP15055 ss-10 TaxID=1314674 RepID=A0A0D7BI13_9AGAR|nr:carnitine/acyl carnitine carrier [Cylindrobasidium torrendii FP15055 ss-10]
MSKEAAEDVGSATAESVKSFVAGGFGGVCAVLVGHPFDLTKTRLQTAAPGTYTGGLDVVKRTVAKDGLTGMFRGVVPPLLGVTPIFAISFWAYDTSKLLIFAATPNRKSETLSIGELATAGFMSAVPTTLVTAPVERAKVLLQVQGQGVAGEKQYKGVIDVIGHLYKEGGLKSIFRGSFATILRDGPGSAAYFAAYEVTKKALTPAGKSPSDLDLGSIIVAGGMAGVAMWSLAIPPDVLKSRIQSAPEGTYSGFLDCAKKTIAADGVKALWRGFGPAMARAFPANAATFGMLKLRVRGTAPLPLAITTSTMRPWRILVSTSLLFGNILCSQTPLSGPSTLASTLVSELNKDPDYELLLRLLQRTRLIPTLNRLNGSTFFAPTNEAIEQHAFWRSILDDGSATLADNVQEQLRQQLFYHLLNYTVNAFPEEASDLQVHKTLHFPRIPLDSPTHEPPPYPPWIPIPGGSLGGEPQRLRLVPHKEKLYVGVDAHGKGGVQVTKGKVDAGNGALFGINKMLEPPPDLATVLSQTPSLSYFNSLLTPDIHKALNSTSALTLFLPTNEAWNSLDKLERTYLESEFASDDLAKILNMHAVSEGVSWSDAFHPALNLTTIDGQNLEIVVSPDKTMVGQADLVEADIYASNGVLHIVNSLMIPPGALQITPEKYLLALNCTSFVSLIHSTNLTSLVNDTEAKYTILAPQDDIFTFFDEPTLPEPGSEELKKMLQYHFLPGRWTPKKLQDGMLLETALQEPGLDGGRQVLEVESDTKKIRFAGASVIGEPVEVNNTLIYFISKALVPPTDALQAALPSLELSSFLAAVSSTSVAKTIKKTPRTSLLIPHNEAFQRLGLLVSAHLLAASSKSDLEKVLLHHSLDSVQYAEELVNGSSHSYSTLEGSDLTLEKDANGTVFLSASGGWAGMRTELYPKNTLTETGVIHELSDLLIPRSVDLTAGKLVKAAKGSTMGTLVSKAGFEWVLNGTAPPEGSRWDQAGMTGAGWTLLCPTDDAFKDYNLTELYQDTRRLESLVVQHLIPMVPPSLVVAEALNNNRPLHMDDSATYATVLTRDFQEDYGDVVFKEVESAPGSYVVGIKGARGTNGKTHAATVMAWGRSTTGGGTGGVIQIDQVLEPYYPGPWRQYGAPAVVGVLGIILIVLFFLGVTWVMRRDTTEATYEPVGGFGRNEEDD